MIEQESSANTANNTRYAGLVHGATALMACRGYMSTHGVSPDMSGFPGIA